MENGPYIKKKEGVRPPPHPILTVQGGPKSHLTLGPLPFPFYSPHPILVNVFA